MPDPSNLFDYNRYLYTRGNPMRYTDPTGHQSCMAMAPAMPLVLGCQAGELAMRYGPTIMQLAVQWADKLPAVDWLFSSAEQGGIVPVNKMPVVVQVIILIPMIPMSQQKPHPTTVL